MQIYLDMPSAQKQFLYNRKYQGESYLRTLQMWIPQDISKFEISFIYFYEFHVFYLSCNFISLFILLQLL